VFPPLGPSSANGCVGRLKFRRVIAQLVFGVSSFSWLWYSSVQRMLYLSLWYAKGGSMLLGGLNFVEVAQPVWEFLARFHGSESSVRWAFYSSPIQVHGKSSILGSLGCVCSYLCI
jgi:hypothetical protein